MNTDILVAENPSKKVETTMFEVNDTNRQHEFTGTSYINPFIGFIESLGFDVEVKEHLTDDVIIAGFKVHIDTKNASYMSRQAFTRKTAVRKPENRYISLTAGYPERTIIRIPFNKELPTQRLKDKINQAIQDAVDKEERLDNLKQQRNQNLIDMANWYLCDSVVKNATRQLLVHQGVISFYLTSGVAAVQLNANGTLLAVNFHSKECKSEDEMFEYVTGIADKYTEVERVVCQLTDMNKPPEALQEWAATHYHGYFDVKTMSIKD